MTRKRISAKYATATGGGSTPTVGNVRIGPDFGEDAGSDGKTVSLSMTPSMGPMGARGEVSLTMTPQLTGVQVGSPSTVPTLTMSVSGTALGAPFFQSVTTGGGNAVTSPAQGVINVPSGTVNGNLLIAVVGARCATGTVGITAPSGWTEFASQANSTNLLLKAYYRYASSEPSTYQWDGTGTTNTAVGISMTRLTGTAASSPIDVSATGSGSAVSPIAPTVTTATANCWVLIACTQADTTDQSYTPPAGWTERYDTQFGTAASLSLIDMAGDDKVFSATGATGAQTMTRDGLVAGNYCTVTIAVKPGTITL